MVTDLLATNGYIITNKKLIKECGLYEAILIGELCSESNYWMSQGKLENGWYFSTIENVEYNTIKNNWVFSKRRRERYRNKKRKWFKNARKKRKSKKYSCSLLSILWSW